MQDEIITACFKSKSTKVKTMLLLTLTKDIEKKYIDAIIRLTFDFSKSVRDIAKFVTKDLNLNYANIYISNIEEGINIAGSLLALSEVEYNNSIDIISLYLKSSNPKIKYAAIKAISNINLQMAKEIAKNNIINNSSKITSLCIKLLCNNPDMNTISLARKIFSNGNVLQRKSMIILFKKIGNYEIISDLIIGLIDIEETIRKRCRNYIIIWLNKESVWYNNPSEKQRERIRTSLIQVKNKLGKTNPHQKGVWSKMEQFLKQKNVL